MTTYFISRHLGSIEWMKHTGHHYDIHLTHLDNNISFKAGDRVIGSLPINMVADLNAKGVHYYHLTLIVPESLRGVELSAQELLKLDATLEAYQVTRLNSSL